MNLFCSVFVLLYLEVASRDMLLPSVIRKCRRAPQLDGPDCRALFTKHYWDELAQDCVQMTYGGCRGTDGLFNSRQLCLDECNIMTRAPPCPPPLPPPFVDIGCEIVSRQKLDGCFDKLVHCPDRIPTRRCDLAMHRMQDLPDCQYVEITGVDGCSKRVLDCSAGTPRPQEIGPVDLLNPGVDTLVVDDPVGVRVDIPGAQYNPIIDTSLD